MSHRNLQEILIFEDLNCLINKFVAIKLELVKWMSESQL